MDVDRVKAEKARAEAFQKLQWSHVLMDVDRLSTAFVSLPGFAFMLQWSHVLMDVDSCRRMLPYASFMLLQWSHVLMDVDSPMTPTILNCARTLQWSHVLMDVDRIALH